MIEWYKDENLKIEFSSIPDCKVRFVPPYATKKEVKEITSKPFVITKDLTVKINNLPIFVIPAGFCWNGSDIPRIFYTLLNESKDSAEMLVASCLHDFSLEHKNIINYDRRLSTDIFRGCLITAKVPVWKANLMAQAVDWFQKTICSKSWKH